MLIQDGGLAAAALLGGHFLGAMVARALRARNFDAALRLSSSFSPATELAHGFTPTLIAGIFVRLTVWAGAACWLARQHGWPELAGTLGLILSRTWALLGVLVAALILARLLARRAIECLHGVTRASEASTSRNGTTGPSREMVGAVGAGVYRLVLLLALLFAADLFDWPLAGRTAQALWQLAQHLLVAGAALLIGGLGARWARDLVTLEGAASPEKRAGQYTALGIVSATTVLAVAVLLSSAGLFLGLAALAVLATLLWFMRGYLPDIAAGLQLRAHGVREVWLEGTPWQVAEVGLLSAAMGHAGQFSRFQNRQVLEACMHGASAESRRR